MASTSTIERVRKLLKIVGWISPEIAGEIALRLFTTPKRIPRPQWEIDLAREGSFRYGPGQIVSRSYGPLGAPTVILAHGWEGRGLQLGLLIDPLLRRGFRIVAVDAPAHGDSYGRRTNIARYAENLATLAKDLREEGSVEVSVVAHSFGAGSSALSMQGGAQFDRAILVAAPSSLSTVADDFVEGLQLSQRVADIFRRRLQKWTGIDLMQADLAMNGSRIETPTLVVHDPADKVVPFWHAERFAANWPGAQLLPLEKVGHYKILKAPGFIDAAVNFLESPRK
jgi:pimeloyl-ACP methyl ester carboxylesterase